MKKYLVIVALMVVMLCNATPVFASDPLQVRVDIWSDDPQTLVNLWGDNPDTFVNIFGNNGNVYINGVHLSSWSSQFVSQAVRQSVPNGNYSGAGSPGWQGYFGILTNDTTITIEHKNPGTITYYVYRGAGCGGRWGVSDGYPDMWSRRQLLGLLPVLATYKNKLDSIGEQITKLPKSNTKEVDLTYINDNIKYLNSTMSQVITIIDENVMQGISDTNNAMDKRFLYMLIIFGTLILMLLAWCIVLTIKVKRN